MRDNELSNSFTAKITQVFGDPSKKYLPPVLSKVTIKSLVCLSIYVPILFLQLSVHNYAFINYRTDH